MTNNIKFIVAGALVFGVVLGGIVAALLGRETAPDFTQFEAGQERKQAFFEYFLPIVQDVNQELLQARVRLLEIRSLDEISDAESSYVTEVALSVGMKSFDNSDADWATLLRRVDIVPPSLALAQAANESAWGTSRFAKQGNNFFGQWCFEEGCGIVPAKRDAGKTHEVADFSSPSESVESYVSNLNSNGAYRELRNIRADLRKQEARISGVALASGLSKYSERGDEYISELRQMIRFNKLGELDRTLLPAADGTVQSDE